ncbi:MAG: hypothetical protein IKE70_04710 [Bacilli bacterium]|nr:hypothetical protein [Bacilli bacterium]
MFNNQDEWNKMFDENKSININDLNQMNIVINDNDCSDLFFQDLCDELEKNGLQFQVTKGDHNLPVEGIVITIDQQYSSGSNSFVFAPFSNTRFGFSDSLALSLRSGMMENGCSVNLVGGKVGYQVDDFGNVSTLVPTSTEEKIPENNDISFATISIGTEKVSADLLAKSILSGLARQKYFLENEDTQTDLIYRANLGESVEDVAHYFGVSQESLISYNRLPDKSVLNSQTIINPGIEKMDVFHPESKYFVHSEVVHKTL